MTSQRLLPVAAALMLISLAACSSAATSAPSTAATAAPPTTAVTIAPQTAAPTEPAAQASRDPRIGIFCADFTARLVAAWPPADAAAAVALGPIFADFAMNPGLAAIASDLQTVDEWTQMAARGLATTPSQPVLDAFARISAFAVANC